ncbi:MAG: PDZ domain-containing protein, partial [Myxococcota bacterium]
MHKTPLPFALIFTVVFSAGCLGSTNTSFEPALPADYSGMGWTAAFDAMVKKISAEYAFTEWKGINWTSLKNNYRVKVSEAESAGDLKAYYKAIRAFALEIPDGHVSLPADNLGLLDENIGAGYGLALAELDDGRFVASAIIKDGPASVAGIVTGAEITLWNGVPVSTAVSGQSTLWASRTMPTGDMKKLIQLELLARDAAGAAASVTHINPGALQPKTVELVAANDGYASLEAAGFIKVPAGSDAAKMVEWKVLDTGYGYIRLYYEIAIEDGKIVPGYPKVVYDLFRAAIQEMVDK